jgi:carotenoid 1,2-hydratase
VSVVARATAFAGRRLPPLPTASGAYRWFYLDVVAGDVTAVCIFLVGSVFSPRYAVRGPRGARPSEHCAVNLALYRGGRRTAWVLSEYGDPACTGDTLRIGESTFSYDRWGGVEVNVTAREAPFGRRVHAAIALEPAGPPGPELALDASGAHRWRPVAPRCRASLTLPEDRRVLEGVGYHDTNHGDVPLGGALPRWSWTRVHGSDQSAVSYRLPGSDAAIDVQVRAGVAPRVERRATKAPADRRSGWGLRVPRRLAAGDVDLPADRLLESSPFYARLEGRKGGVSALGEVADFRRFHSPLVRWMAHFRTRVESA